MVATCVVFQGYFLQMLWVLELKITSFSKQFEEQNLQRHLNIVDAVLMAYAMPQSQHFLLIPSCNSEIVYIPVAKINNSNPFDNGVAGYCIFL